MKIADYTTSDAKALDRLVATDADTGATKNVTAEDLANFSSAGQYKAILNQVSTAAPVATLDSSNLSAGTWSYTNTGQYHIDFDSPLATDVIIILGAISDPTTTINAIKSGASTVSITTRSSGVLADDLLSGQYIEIKSFNA